jgi:hypothetical protein
MKNKLLLALVISIGASLFFTLYTPTVAVEQNVTKLKPLKSHLNDYGRDLIDSCFADRYSIANSTIGNANICDHVMVFLKELCTPKFIKTHNFCSSVNLQKYLKDASL